MSQKSRSLDPRLDSWLPSRVTRPDQFNTSQEEASTRKVAGVWLIAVAAPKELDAVLGAFDYAGGRPGLFECARVGARFDVVYTGVGKSSAAGAVARCIDLDRHVGVLSAGIAGSLPGSDCQVGQVVCASSSVFGDEGVMTPTGFEACAQMGFGAFDGGGDGIEHPQAVVDWLGGFANHIGPVACVSMCSGTDALAERVWSSTHGICEAMEGAAVALAAHRVGRGLMTGELRVISNRAGDRDQQQWDLGGALKTLGCVLGRISSECK